MTPAVLMGPDGEVEEITHQVMVYHKKGEEIVDYLSGDPQNGYRGAAYKTGGSNRNHDGAGNRRKDVRISEVTYDPEEKTYRIHVKTEGTDSFGREFSDTDGGLTLQFMIRLPQKNQILTEEDIESLGAGNVYGYRPGDRIGYAQLPDAVCGSLADGGCFRHRSGGPIPIS